MLSNSTRDEILVDITNALYRVVNRVGLRRAEALLSALDVGTEQRLRPRRSVARCVGMERLVVRIPTVLLHRCRRVASSGQ